MEEVDVEKQEYVSGLCNVFLMFSLFFLYHSLSLFHLEGKYTNIPKDQTQTNKQTNKQADRQTDRQTYLPVYLYTYLTCVLFLFALLTTAGNFAAVM